MCVSDRQKERDLVGGEKEGEGSKDNWRERDTGYICTVDTDF